ncbi:MAG: type IX secretion system membrane protein PorP/SprF [Flavobacteriales bacterium]
MRGNVYKAFVLLLPLIGLAGAGKAQQLPQYSQYMFNRYYNNPAVAGSEDVSFASLGYRAQWAGLKGAPTTSMAAFHTAFKENVGLGGMLFTDKNGPFRRSGLRLSYAYQLKVSDKTKLGLGLAGVLYQHSLNKENLDPRTEGDPALNGEKRKSIDPDGIFGAYLSGADYYVSFTSSHLFKSEMFGDSLGGTQLSRHFYLGGGYAFDLSKKWELEPSVMMRATKGAPLHFDINGKLLYDDLVWTGISYRSSGSLLAMLGLQKGQLRIGYSYDLTLSEIRNYSSGSHEIHLGMKIPSGKSVKFPSF